MAITYVNDLRLSEMDTGDNSGTWGTVTNTNLELIGEALGYGTEAITTNADTHASVIADGATDPVRALYVEYTGTLDSACTITISPNTVNKVCFIENGTSGSQNIIISQGSGANVTIPPGDTKAVYLNGAGSGAAVVDAFASLSVVDLKVQDDLTVTDDMTVGGTLGVTGIATFTDDIIIGDGKTIGSASTVGAITIASDGDITLSADLNVGANFDVTGNAVIDGTALVTGVLTTTAATVFNGGFASNAASTITTADNLSGLIVACTDADANTGPTIQLKRDSSTTAANDLLGNLIFVGENDADEATVYANIGSQNQVITNGSESGRFFINTIVGGTEYSRFFADATETVINENSRDLDFRVESDSLENALYINGEHGVIGMGIQNTTAAQNLHILGNDTTPSAHILLQSDDTANATAKISMYARTSDNSNRVAFIENSAGDLKLDTTGDIILDADGGDVALHDNGTAMGRLGLENGDLNLASMQQDYDVRIKGNDGGSVITALTFDMSSGGSAIFSGSVAGNNVATQLQNTNAGADGDAVSQWFGLARDGGYIFQNSGEIKVIKEQDWTTTASTIDASMTFSTQLNENLTEHMRLLSNGTLLVGKTGQDDAAAGFQITGGNVATITSSSGYTFQVNDTSAFKWRVNANGGVYNFSSNNVNLSDQREKKNIEALDAQWDAVKAWSVKEFHYNADEDSDAKKVGVIAQEVETNHPELVTDFELTEDTTRKAVKEQQMMWLAIKALQEAQARIETLEARITALEA